MPINSSRRTRGGKRTARSMIPMGCESEDFGFNCKMPWKRERPPVDRARLRSAAQGLKEKSPTSNLPRGERSLEKLWQRCKDWRHEHETSRPVQALKQMQTMGLKDLLAGPKATWHAKTSIAQKRSSNKQRSERFKPGRRLKNEKSEHGTKKVLPTSPINTLAGPSSKQEIPAKHPLKPRLGGPKLCSNRSHCYSHTTRHQAIESVHEVGEVDHGGNADQNQSKHRQEEPAARYHG